MIRLNKKHIHTLTGEADRLTVTNGNKSLSFTIRDSETLLNTCTVTYAEPNTGDVVSQQIKANKVMNYIKDTVRNLG